MAKKSPVSNSLASQVISSQHKMTSAAINYDLDSSIIKALRLLHSSDSDSENQLRQLWKQSVFEKFGTTRVPTSVLQKIQIPTSIKRERQEDIIDLETESKKFKSENSKTSHKSKTLQTIAPYSSHDIDLFNPSKEVDDDDGLEIFIETEVCVKCKKSSSIVNDKLVECVDCQKQYHQLCHFPPITTADLSDPRFVWYCSSCEENISTEKTKHANIWSPSKSSSNVESSSFGAKLSSSGSNAKLIDKSNSSRIKEKHGHSSKKQSSRKHEKKHKSRD